MTEPLNRSVLARLAGDRNAWLCTLRPDGSPHITPIWYVYREGTWWIGSSERAVKVRNLDNDPRVSLTLENGDRPVVAEGTARVHRENLSASVVAAFAEKYNGWDVTEVWGNAGPRLLIEVTMTRWLLAGTAR